MAGGTLISAAPAGVRGGNATAFGGLGGGPYLPPRLIARPETGPGGPEFVNPPIAPPPPPPPPGPGPGPGVLGPGGPFTYPGPKLDIEPKKPKEPNQAFYRPTVRGDWKDSYMPTTPAKPSSYRPPVAAPKPEPDVYTTPRKPPLAAPQAPQAPGVVGAAPTRPPGLMGATPGRPGRPTTPQTIGPQMQPTGPTGLRPATAPRPTGGAGYNPYPTQPLPPKYGMLPGGAAQPAAPLAPPPPPASPPPYFGGGYGGGAGGGGAPTGPGAGPGGPTAAPDAPPGGESGGADGGGGNTPNSPTAQAMGALPRLTPATTELTPENYDQQTRMYGDAMGAINRRLSDPALPAGMKVALQSQFAQMQQSMQDLNSRWQARPRAAQQVARVIG